MRVLRSRGPALVAAVASLIALAAACGPRRPASSPTPEATPDAKADSSPAPTEDDIRNVSVGYGTQSRRELTVSVGSVTERDIGQTRVTRVEELLQGRVPGVMVSRRPNGEFSVRIRGAGTFMGNGEPLWVLDDMPLNAGGSASGALASINPQDIARIDVLRDAGATAIYGSRGMNGVILLRTKSH